MCFLPSLLSFRHWKFLVAPPCWYTAALVVLDVTDTDVFTPHPPTSHQMGFLAAAAMNILPPPPQRWRGYQIQGVTEAAKGVKRGRGVRTEP